MDKFWELLERSVIFTSIVTLMIVGTCCYLWVTGSVVPELLASILTMILGFFFGSKVMNVSRARVLRSDGTSKFWSLMEQSVLVSGIVTLMILGVSCYLWSTGRAVPELLASSMSMIMGFFFGSKQTRG